MYRESDHRIFVGHLDPVTTQETLRLHFSKFGKLCECTLKKSMKNSKQVKCFAFVAYEDQSHAVECLEALHQIDRREIDVKPAVEEVDAVSEKMVLPAKLFVGALPVTCDSEKLSAAFRKYGTILSSTVMNDRRSNRSRLFGFVEFLNSESVTSVLEDYWSHFIDSKWVETKRCVPKFNAGDGEGKASRKRINGRQMYDNKSGILQQRGGDNNQVSSMRLLESRISERRRRIEREVRETCELEGGKSKQQMLEGQKGKKTSPMLSGTPTTWPASMDKNSTDNSNDNSNNKGARMVKRYSQDGGEQSKGGKKGKHQGAWEDGKAKGGHKGQRQGWDDGKGDHHPSHGYSTTAYSAIASSSNAKNKNKGWGLGTTSHGVNGGSVGSTSNPYHRQASSVYPSKAKNKGWGKSGGGGQWQDDAQHPQHFRKGHPTTRDHFLHHPHASTSTSPSFDTNKSTNSWPQWPTSCSTVVQGTPSYRHDEGGTHQHQRIGGYSTNMCPAGYDWTGSSPQWPVDGNDAPMSSSLSRIMFEDTPDWHQWARGLQ